MIQAGMYFALGVLVAGLVAVAIMPAIWRRALRLTRARAEAAIPLTRAEINADKDKLRATFATSNRKLELQAGQLRQRISDQLVEVNRERDVSSGLRAEKAALAEEVAGLESIVEDLAGRFDATEKDLAVARSEIEARKATLAEREKELAALGESLQEAQQLTEAQRLEQVALTTEIGNLKDEIEIADRKASATEAERAGIAAELSAGNARLADATRRTDALEERIRELEAARAGDAADVDRAMGAARAARLEADERALRATALEDRVAGLSARRDEIAAELEMVSRDRDARADDVARHAAELAEARGDLESERGRAEEADRNATGSESALQALREELESTNADRLELIKALNDTRDELERNRGEPDTLRERIAALEAEAGERSDELETVRGTVSAREAELAEARDSAEEARVRAEEALARVTAAEDARAQAEKALEERTTEVEALNAELHATATGAVAASKVDSAASGDNIEKALADAEETNARLTAQIGALEREARQLRLENDRMRELTSTDKEQTAVSRQLGRVGEAVARLSGNDDEPPPGNGHRDEATERTKSPQPETADEEEADKPGSSLADRLRDLQQPSART